jgi:hypothetical protein
VSEFEDLDDYLAFPTRAEYHPRKDHTQGGCATFASLLPDSGVPIENIARLVGHAGGFKVTETVYRMP